LMSMMSVIPVVMMSRNTANANQKKKIMSEVVWQSTITKDMVRHLDQDIIDELIGELDDVVASVAEEYEVE